MTRSTDGLWQYHNTTMDALLQTLLTRNGRMALERICVLTRIGPMTDTLMSHKQTSMLPKSESG